MDIKIKIPKDVEYIINEINANGFEAYSVGGCVRDSLLNKEPKDWDITTSAKPQEIKQIFPKTIDTGIEHGTVTVRLHGENYEVTTYRIDGKYDDGRHPNSVSFSTSLKEDLMRRDFTINSMAYSPKDGLIDMYDGVNDLSRGIIRCVGNPIERFSEDALRMLRAIRFAGQLGFKIEEKTKAAITELSENIVKVSCERIMVEISKLIISNNPDKLMLLFETGISKYFLPEWDRMASTEQNNINHIYSVGEHTIKVLQAVKSLYTGNDERELRVLSWSAFLHDVAKPDCLTTDENGTDHFYGHPQKGSRMAQEVLKRLKFDNYTISMVTRIINYHDYRFDGNRRNIRRFMSKAGVDILPYLFILMEADLCGQSDYNREEKRSRIEEAKDIVKDILDKQESVSIKDLCIGGNDLMQVGIPQGKIIGDIMNRLLEDVLDEPKHNDRKYLLGKAMDIYKK